MGIMKTNRKYGMLWMRDYFWFSSLMFLSKHIYLVREVFVNFDCFQKISTACNSSYLESEWVVKAIITESFNRCLVIHFALMHFLLSFSQFYTIFETSLLFRWIQRTRLPSSTERAGWVWTKPKREVRKYSEGMNRLLKIISKSNCFKENPIKGFNSETLTRPLTGLFRKTGKSPKRADYDDAQEPTVAAPPTNFPNMARICKKLFKCGVVFIILFQLQPLRVCR